MFSKKLVSRTLFSLSLFVFLACGSVREMRNTGEVDDRWAGEWKGKMLIENSLLPPKLVDLQIEFTSTHIKAFYTDSLAKVFHQIVNKLKIEGDEIQFQIAYDTDRGLRAFLEFSGKRYGQYLMVEFSGSEGGKPFRGKWEARQAERVTTPRALKSVPTPKGKDSF